MLFTDVTNWVFNVTTFLGIDGSTEEMRILVLNPVDAVQLFKNTQLSM